MAKRITTDELEDAYKDGDYWRVRDETRRARAREERLEKALREILEAAGASDAEIANYVWRTATKALEEQRHD
jgi:hypothetical protein